MAAPTSAIVRISVERRSLALVWNANTSGDTIDGLHRTLDAERKRIAKLVEENLRLEEDE